MHAAAEQGFSREAVRYTSSRPGYPHAMVERVATAFRTTSPNDFPVVADIGAGSGTLGALLQRRDIRVVSAEPTKELLLRAPQTVRHVAVRALADQLPFLSSRFDGVVVATAFHWFATPESLDEFARVTKQRATLALSWNDRDHDVPWVRDFDEVIERDAGDTPRFRDLEWKRVIDAHEAWELVDMAVHANPRETTVEGVVDRALSISYIAALDQDRKRSIGDELRQRLAGQPDVFEFPYQTKTWLYRRRPA